MYTSAGITPTPCDQKEDLACYTNTDDVLIYDGPAGRIVTDYRNQPPDSYTIVKNDNGRKYFLKVATCTFALFVAF